MNSRRAYYEQEKNTLKELMIELHSIIVKSPHIVSIKGTEINVSIAYGVCLKFVKNILKENDEVDYVKVEDIINFTERTVLYPMIDKSSIDGNKFDMVIKDIETVLRKCKYVSEFDRKQIRREK
ncbi:hypothetical protein [Fusobacterium varium]|uniref:hypothetical protein n=1 Tax=Fusobacterium varium TaxID=856 RepID=UPI003565278E